MSSDAAHPNPEVARRLQHIYTLHRTEIDLRLGQSPYNTLLQKLGNPQNKLPPVIHVAGTNGKGSTIAFLQAMLEAAGYKVHTYTSPHLIVFNERIRLAGKLIDDATLIRLYDHVDAINAGAPITFFEYTTAIAFLAMAETPADIVLLETGMGGRLDCTNVIDKPALTIITKISFDHTEFLGNTLPAIATEKAGIMKSGVPCIIGAQMDADAVLPVFKNAAKNLRAPLLIAGQDYANSLPLGYPTPNLVGAHQIENAATALAALDNLTGFSVPDSARKHGLTHTQWPARLQRITSGPVAALIPTGWELWFDAAHNDSGAQALANQLKIWKGDGPVHLIVGLAADKDASAFFSPLKGLYDTLTLIDLPQARKPQTAAELKQKLGATDAQCAVSLKDAIEKVAQKSMSPARICVAGSLYLYQDVN